MRKVVPLALPLFTLLSACGDCDTRGQTPIEYTGGNNPTATTYETGGIFGEYLHFPAGRRFDLMHNLGVTPGQWETYVTFQRLPGQSSDDNTGNIAESAGNQAVVECADEQRLRVRNDTCAEFYLRVFITAAGDEQPRPCGAVSED